MNIKYDLDIFKNSISTLKETSKDESKDRNGIVTNKYMTKLEFNVINFDKVKEKYIKNYKMANEIKSVDTLIFEKNLDIFVEFKNGDITYYKKTKDCKNEKQLLDKLMGYVIDWKIRDSLLIYCDLLNKTISYTRENLDFILVYNEDKNKDRDNLKKKIINLAKHGDEFVKWGFGKYKIFFRNVHTYTEKEFEKHIKENKIKGDLI